MSMPHPDTTFHGVRVSWAWNVVWRDVEKRVKFRLNSGRRTKEEQLKLIAQKGVWSPTNNHGAAAYSPTAPHVAVGMQNHANDVDSFFGDGENAVQRELERMGLKVVNNVPGEAWHQQVYDEQSLIDLANKIIEKNSSPKLHKGVVNRAGTKKLQSMLRAKGYRSVIINGKFDVLTRIAVRKFQKKNKIMVTSRTDVGLETWRQLRA